ncbi:MAG: deoxycytidine triphosphate deaminase [Bacteroidota bacterium]|jgi:dCTP deaminase
MILTAHAIQEANKLGEVTIRPFTVENLGTISYRFSLGDFMIIIDQMQDSKKPSRGKLCKIPSAGMLLHPDTLYLAATYEKLGATRLAQMIFGLKQTAALGIYLDISSNLGHVGAVTHWTLEITVVQPVVIYPRISIGQIVFWRMQGDYDRYEGNYNQQVLPEKSLLWLE